MGIRRYCCFLLLVGVLAYILGALMYLFGRDTTLPSPVTFTSKDIWGSFNSYKGKTEDISQQYNPSFNDQPDSYTIDPPQYPFKMKVDLPPATNNTERQAAAFIVLVRNAELLGMIQSMNDIGRVSRVNRIHGENDSILKSFAEQRFNHKFNYPWVFLNEQSFTEEFINMTTSISSGETHYGFVNESMWGYPDWIDQDYAAKQRQIMQDLPYGSSESYRHMCRFQSGFFWRHPLVLSLNLEYYWRVEPDVRYFCDLDYDPFLYMKQNKKKYAFNISFKEHKGTIPTLWESVKTFARESTKRGKIYFNNPYKDSLFNFLSENEGESYNGCHFWTNFEIARLDLWHTEAYQEFYASLDYSGGFFYERWGDAPVHSIFAALYLRKDEIHFFNDIGYKHSIYSHCPAEDPLVRRCSCDPADSLDFSDHMSCLREYMSARDFNPPHERRTVNDILINR